MHNLESVLHCFWSVVVFVVWSHVTHSTSTLWDPMGPVKPILEGAGGPGPHGILLRMAPLPHVFLAAAPPPLALSQAEPDLAKFLQWFFEL